MGKASKSNGRFMDDFLAGLTCAEIAKKHNCNYTTVYEWANVRGLKIAQSRAISTHPYGTVDNAVTAAFREVFGWCPFRDGERENGRSALPKNIVDPDEVCRRSHDQRRVA